MLEGRPKPNTIEFCKSGSLLEILLVPALYALPTRENANWGVPLAARLGGFVPNGVGWPKDGVKVLYPGAATPYCALVENAVDENPVAENT